MQLILNGAKCLLCGDTIYSRHVHDFKYCSCQALSVNGGNEYRKRGGRLEAYQEASAFSSRNDKGDECQGMFLVYSPQGKTNSQTVFCRKEDAMRAAIGSSNEFGGTWYVAGPLDKAE
jgi:hypothetical protein